MIIRNKFIPSLSRISEPRSDSKRIQFVFSIRMDNIREQRNTKTKIYKHDIINRFDFQIIFEIIFNPLTRSVHRSLDWKTESFQLQSLLQLRRIISVSGAEIPFLSRSSRGCRGDSGLAATSPGCHLANTRFKHVNHTSPLLCHTQ